MSFRKRSLAGVAVVCLAALAIVVASAGADDGKVKNYNNNFDANTNGWCDLTSSQGPCDGVAGWGTIDQVSSGFSNYGGYAPFINAQKGPGYARVSGIGDTLPASACDPNNGCLGPYTDWNNGLDRAVFPKKGGTTSLDIYLDTSWAASHPDIRFDYDSNMNDNTGNYLQDYVFNVGTNPSGDLSAPGFYVSASTNAQRGSTFPENNCPGPNTGRNACRPSVHITASGWYRFVHRFFNDGGFLGVQMSIVQESTGQTITPPSWIIVVDTNPNNSQPIDISGVGGMRRGYFPNEEILGLPIDEASIKADG
jgi:hypothetical protein